MERRLFFMMTVLCFFPAEASPHGSRHRGDSVQEVNGSAEISVMEKINIVYKERVRPILSVKCFDCHTHQTRYPGVPG